MFDDHLIGFITNITLAVTYVLETFSLLAFANTIDFNLVLTCEFLGQFLCCFEGQFVMESQTYWLNF